MTPASHAGGPEFEPRTVYSIGRVAQMAERRSNKPSVVGSIPTVTIFLNLLTACLPYFILFGSSHHSFLTSYGLMV
jgi:hypothetical protein